MASENRNAAVHIFFLLIHIVELGFNSYKYINLLFCLYTILCIRINGGIYSMERDQSRKKNVGTAQGYIIISIIQ